MKPHISPSQVNMYLRCPAQYYFRYVEGVILPPKAAMTRGKAVHHSIETNYKQKIESHEDLPLSDVLDVAATAFEIEAEHTEWEPDETPGSVKDETIQLAGLYHTAIAPTVQPVCVEARAEIPLEGTEKTLLGFIDVIDSGGFIRDTKTSRRAPGADEAERSLQLTAYCLAFRYLTGEREAGVKLDYLVHTKTPKAVTLDATRTEDDILRFQSIVAGVLSGIEHNVYYPNPNNHMCSEKWCGYWHECHKVF